MGVDRYLRETVYHLRRKYSFKQQKKMPMFSVVTLNKTNQISAKKLVGIGLVLVGLLLLLSQCFFGGSAKNKESKTTEQEVAIVQVIGTGEDRANQDKNNAEIMQDFPLDPTLTRSLLKLSSRYQQVFSDTLATWSIGHAKNLSEKELIQSVKNGENYLEEDGGEAFFRLSKLYDQFIYDIKEFPVSTDMEYSYTYENTWKEGRRYRGNGMHFGTDILANDVPSGVVSIKSMASGIVENVGWNELGGYRVGIRSNGGAYFYYAHLAEAPTYLQKGDYVMAGQNIGLMGDTGYGPEGTTGKFPVHLHVGIGLVDEEGNELWINPYPILQYLETMEE